MLKFMNKRLKTKQNKKIKILLIVGGFYPGKKYGGIVTSRLNFCEALKSRFDIYVLTTDHDYNSNQKYENIGSDWNNYRGYRVKYINDKMFTNSCIKSIIDYVEPSIIYFSGTITSYFKFNHCAIKYACKKNIPCLVSPDGDLGQNALRIKTLKKRFAIFLCKFLKVFKKVFFYVTSKEEKINLSSLLKIKEANIYEGTNISYPITPRLPIVKNANSLRTVYSSRIHPQKNLLFILQSFSKFRGLDITLDIYGEIEDSNYWKMCCSLMKNNKNIRYLGLLDCNSAREVYKSYDCLLMPTLGDNYSHTVEESIMSGCPVVLTKGVTPWDSIDGKAGFLFEKNSCEGFENIIFMLYAMDSIRYNDLEKSTQQYADAFLNPGDKANIFADIVFDILLKEGNLDNE